MEDGKQLSTTSKQLGVRREELGVRREELGVLMQRCPVAQRLYDRTGDGLPLAVVAVVAAVDRSITTAAESVRTAGQVSVKRFAKDFDERTLAALILTHLTIVEDMLNVARPMKPEAMAMLSKEVARMLVEDDMTINLADIQIVADRLANGEAGPVYGGLNKGMVIKAFTGYLCEKGNAFADWREQQAKEQYGSGLGRERTRADYEDAVRAGERVKHIAAREAYLNGTLKKDIKQ